MAISNINAIIDNDIHKVWDIVLAADNYSAWRSDLSKTEIIDEKQFIEYTKEGYLDKSGSYIRGITSGAALPSLKELFNIIAYFNMTPAEFFAPMDDTETPYRELCEKLRTMNDEDLAKVSTFVGWIEKKI